MSSQKQFEVLEEAETRPGQIQDFISGQWIRATPEEIDAVQILSRRLVEDYGYDPGQIQTRPQFRVRKRPSDEEKSYPVDIALFKSERKTEDNLYLIAECKKKNRKDGLAQLKLYLDMSPAEVGVWFNGEDHAYLRKVHYPDGRVTYPDLPNIPRKGQRVEDIGLFHRRDLKVSSDLKSVFRDIRNHLAGNVTGITRDEALAQQIINILFCKIDDEINKGPDEIVNFRSGTGEPAEEVKARILGMFDAVKQAYDDVFDASDQIILDAENLAYVVGELQIYCITEAARDAVGDAFEVFIGPALRGPEGQFFTPRNVVKMIVDILDPQPGEMIIDPAAGSGGFLIVALEHVWQRLEQEAKAKKWSAVQLDRKRRETASKCFRGIDKDSFLAKVTKAYMAIIGDGRGGVFCENSLLPPEDWSHRAQETIKLGSFNVVLTNPPFGTKIPIKGQHVLAQYDLGHKWQRDKESGVPTKTSVLYDDQAPQLLFLERCLQLLSSGGRMGIVLPESIFGNPTYEHVITFVRSQAKIIGVVAMPEELFKTSGKGGTHTKTCILFVEKTKPIGDYDIFMSVVRWCGHDSRGNPTLRKNNDGSETLLDDVPSVAPQFRHLRDLDGETPKFTKLGFRLRSSLIRKTVFVPKYYDPDLENDILALAQSHDLVTVGELVEQRLLSITTGDEIGKMAYGTGRIPFIRTSDISNWELKADPKHGVSSDIYHKYRHKQAVRPHDILMVRDGTYLIGTTAIITEQDTHILFQSHIYKIRSLDSEKMDPFLLLALLNAPIVKRQVRAKQFTQDIIDTLGRRIDEIVLPIPKDRTLRERIARETRETVLARAALRNKARQIALEVEGLTELKEEDRELLEVL